MLKVDATSCFGATHKMDTSSINTEKASIEEYNQALDEADEAILAGTEMYELINNHLQHLGKELHDYERKLEADNDTKQTYRNDNKENRSLNKENRMRMRAEKRRNHRSNRDSRSQASGSVAPVIKTRHGRCTASLSASTNDAAVAETVEEEGTSEPNEPRYCVCNQVSYGDMIACDNEKCEQEWFHFSCVAVTSPPKDKWYCPQCKNKMRYKRAHNRTEL